MTGTDVTYTKDADFEKGTLVNVNHDTPNNDQLQLNKSSGTFKFIWVALSQRCTIAKIDTVTGVILGEYRTMSDDLPCPESSRTTVALDGSVWVGHRGGGGRVTHVGLAELNECVDRNGNGTIETSTGYGDVKPWPGTGTPVSAAQDECILHHIDPAPGAGDSRHMSVDKDGNVWVGDRAGGSIFRKYNGSTAALMAGPLDFNCGGYGGLIDGNGVIWSATSGGSILRYDTTQPIDATNPKCLPYNNYGVAIDSKGNVWVSTLGEGIVRKFSPAGALLGAFPQGNANAQGLAVDGNDDVWISSSLFCNSGCNVSHLRNDGSLVGNVATPTGSGSTGVSVDAAGKVWTANRSSHTAVRIDPTAGPVIGGTPLGQVDLTVNFPAGPGGRPLPYPYNYSDMTGAQLFSSTSPQGSWTVVQDGGTAGFPWQKVTWNTEPQGSVPAGSTLLVEARAADTEAALGSQLYVAVPNATLFNLPGRFIQVRVTFKPTPAGDSPVLSDIRIQGKASPTIATTPSASVPAGGNVSDSATLAGGAAPTGTITFTLYGPGDTICKTAIATRTATVAGNGTYGSGNVVAATAGTYNWVASYGGDPNNNPASSPCGAETVVVTKATPSIRTTPSGSVPAGGNVSDSATVSGGSSPTGSVVFTLYGPGDTTCKTPIATRTGTISGGTASSGNVATGGVGTYNWVAVYSGDANNNSVTSPCGSETVVVTKATPSIRTTPSGSVPAGGNVSDSATVSGGFSPTGSVVFTLYGPGDTTCKTPIATRTGTLSAGMASSGNVTIGAAGTYNWVAVYSGDANNNPVTSPCGSEPVTVTPQRLTGRAYGLAANATALGGAVLVSVSPIPDTGYISTTSSSTTSTPCVATLSGLVSAKVLCASVTTVAFPGKSTASASVADANVAVTGIPTITMRVVKSTSTTTCAGSAGTTTIDYLAVGSTVVISVPTSVAPNTTINVGVVKLVLNEQIAFSTPDKGLTVNAVHATVNSLGLAKVNVIVASSESDIGNCP